LIDFFIKNAKLIKNDELLKNDIFFEIQRRFQEEYSSYFLNNKTFANDSKSISISNYEYNPSKNDYLYFTFEFLTKLLSYLIANNNTNKKNNYELSDNSTNGEYSKDIAFIFKEEKEMKFPITQRNNIPKHKISKNMNSNSPIFKNKKLHIKNNSEDNNKINNNKAINKSKIYNKKNSNIQLNKGEKKSSNNSISSYQINLSGISGTEGLNIGCGNLTALNNKKINKQNEEVALINIGIKSFTPKNSKGKFITKNKVNLNYNNKYNTTISSKPLRIQYKKMHSKSVDKGILLREDKKNIPFDLSDKKLGLFPNYLSNVQNATKDNLNEVKNHKNITQIKKRIANKENNINKIPVQYYNNNNINSKNDKISIATSINDGSISIKNNSKRKK
jgi:hypothetical protein